MILLFLFPTSHRLKNAGLVGPELTATKGYNSASESYTRNNMIEADRLTSHRHRSQGDRSRYKKRQGLKGKTGRQLDRVYSNNYIKT